LTASDKDANLVKSVWRFMLGVDSVSMKDLISKVKEFSGKSSTASYYLIKLLCKPIQTGWCFKNGAPSVSFIQEPLLVETPSIDRQTYYKMTEYWRDYVTAESELFDKAKRFY